MREMESQEADYTKIEYEYAWSWWQFHASQRITLFNYFLVISGILATAYATLLRDDQRTLAFILAVSGTLISIAFLFLDCRNRALIKYGDDALVRVEEKIRMSPGIVSQEAKDDTANKGKLSHRLSKHKVTIRGSEIVVGIFFLGAAIATFRGPAPRDPAAETAAAINRAADALERSSPNSRQLSGSAQNNAAAPKNSNPKKNKK